MQWARLLFRTVNICPFPRVSLDTKIQLVRSLVLAKTLYSSSTLPLKSTDIKRYNAFGRSIRRTMLGIKWSDLISNDSLMGMIDGRWYLTGEDVIGRKAAWCGHVIRRGGLQNAILDGLPAGTQRERGI